MSRKGILIGILGIALLLALAGSGSAHSAYGGINCSYCHSGFPTPLTANGTFFKDNHKFDGLTEPLTSASCTTCHMNLSTVFLPLTQTGQNYSNSHRYNDTTLAAARLPPPACGNCHIDVVANNFTFLNLTPTYLNSTTCENCHRLKYDDWYGTMHRVMLSSNNTAQAMGLPTPPGLSWANMSYVIVSKSELRYLNDSGYLFKRYFAENQTYADYGPSEYTCGRCHTTGYNASGGNQSGLPGIVGTWVEPGIACERCHGPGGNGHQVEANISEKLCLECHNGSTRQGLFLSSAHSPPLKAPTSCLRCHSPFDYAENRTVTGATAINVVCANCHNSHNTSDNQYRELFSPGGFNATTMAVVKDSKNSLFNATATRSLRAAGEKVKDVYDTLMTPALITSGIDASYPGPINVTGPISEVLCSNCHYNHGLGAVGGVNLTHARLNYPRLGLKPATCTDCHMSGTQKNHSFNVKDEKNFPSKTCSRGTECHVTSDQNLNHSNSSIVPVVNEWKSSRHNNTEFVNVGSPENTSRCSRCHSPINWNPLNASQTIAPEDYKGVTCAICHNIHDMGDWLKNTGKPYAWYKRDAYNRTSFYRANYTMESTTTGLCTNCHQNRPEYSVPGWGSRGPHGAVVPHNSTQKEMFNGSYKNMTNFECADCHMYINKTDPDNVTEKILPDNQKVLGHTFRVNSTGLQSTQKCSACHNDVAVANISGMISKIQTDIMPMWNSTNATVENTWEYINSSNLEKNKSMDFLARAFFNLYMVKNDRSWGVHDPQKAKDLLNSSLSLANQANASLGQRGVLTSILVSLSNVTLSVGGNQVFNATALDQNGTQIAGINITWTSSNITVGSIDSTGNLTALAKGTTTVTAANGSVNGTANVTVIVCGPRGDLNCNGISADAGDLVLMKRASIKEIAPNSRYDLNSNGELADAGDLVLMKQASIGEIIL